MFDFNKHKPNETQTNCQKKETGNYFKQCDITNKQPSETD